MVFDGKRHRNQQDTNENEGGTCHTGGVKVGNKTNTQNTPLQQRTGKLNSKTEKLQGYIPTSSIYYENGEYK